MLYPVFGLMLKLLLLPSALYAGTSEFPLDTRLSTVRFFLLQGLAVVAEQIFEKGTGRLVGGWVGRVWMLLVLGFSGANLTRAWYVHKFKT